MFVSVCKAILKRSLEYQRRGLRILRHASVLILGVSVASVILIVSGHNPFVPEAAYANWIADGILEVILTPATMASFIVGILSGVVVSVFGILMLVVGWLAVAMASYDVVINTPNVISAWKVLRDVVNLFFVIILLVIAIGTTLRREQYMWNKNLPRFIIAVIFVNFSRTIVAFVTDFADVIQQTFVAGISTVGFSNLIASFGFPFFTSFTDPINTSSLSAAATSTAERLNEPVTILLSAGIVIVLELIVCAILFVYFVLFLGRVILLWLIAIFGPVAFVSSILPQTQKYYKDWWSKLSQAAILGPMLAFFIWLAITLVPDPTTASGTIGSLAGAPAIPGAAAQPSFLVGVLMMVIILYFGMQQGMGMAGDFGSFVGKAQSFAFGTVLGGLSSAAAFAGKDVLGRLDYGQMRARQGIGRAMSQSNNRLIAGAGKLIGAGGTFGNLRQAFLERQQEGAKRREEAGMVANKQLATSFGTWPVAKLIGVSVERGQKRGAVMEHSGIDFIDALDTMQDETKTMPTRRVDALKKIDEAVEKAEEANRSGGITDSDLANIRQRAQQHREIVNGFGDVNAATAQQRQGIANLEAEQAEQRAIAGDARRPEEERTAAENRVMELEEEINQREGELAQAVRDFPRAQNQLMDERRQQNLGLIQEGQRLSATGGLGFVGRTLVNLGSEVGTQQYLEEKERREKYTKDAERLTGGDKKGLIDYIVKAYAAKDFDKVQAALVALTKNGDQAELMQNARSLPMMQELLRGRFAREVDRNPNTAALPAQEKESILNQKLTDFRKAPDDMTFRDLGVEELFRNLSNNNEAAVAKAMGNVREVDKAKFGSAIASVYTDAVTGETKLIDMEVDVNDEQEITVNYQGKAKKGLRSSLKKMKPGEYVSALKPEDFFTFDAQGNVAGVSALADEYLNALPAQVNEKKFNNLTNKLSEVINKNLATFRRAGGTDAARANRDKLVRMATTRAAEEEEEEEAP